MSRFGTVRVILRATALAVVLAGAGVAVRAAVNSTSDAGFYTIFLTVPVFVVVATGLTRSIIATFRKES